jgi:hypothetical protein
MLNIFPRRLGIAIVALITTVFFAGCQNMGGGDVDPRLTMQSFLASRECKRAQ